jgi:cellulose synthase/poly-beta-1,6-N-acetylglucosamine synthase-like glycosyltransferase
LAASRNLALATASSAALAVIDDDCVPDRGWLGAIAAAFERRPHPDAVTGPILALGDRPPGAYAVSLRESLQAQDHRGQILPWTVGSGANFASSCELLREVGGWDERLGTGSPGRAAEDTDLYYRLLRRGSMIRYEPAAQVRHEWQSWPTRLARRTSYGFGMGALCGMWLRRGDTYALRMLLAYSTMHVRRLGLAFLRGDGRTTREHAQALVSPGPGLFYGVRATGTAKS